MQQELEARRQDIIAKERSLDQAEAAAEKRWAKLTEDVSAKVVIRVHVIPGMHSSSETQEHAVLCILVFRHTDRLQKQSLTHVSLCLSTSTMVLCQLGAQQMLPGLADKEQSVNSLHSFGGQSMLSTVVSGS